MTREEENEVIASLESLCSELMGMRGDVSAIRQEVREIRQSVDAMAAPSMPR